MTATIPDLSAGSSLRMEHLSHSMGLLEMQDGTHRGPEERVKTSLNVGHRVSTQLATRW